MRRKREKNTCETVGKKVKKNLLQMNTCEKVKNGYFSYQ